MYLPIEPIAPTLTLNRSKIVELGAKFTDAAESHQGILRDTKYIGDPTRLAESRAADAIDEHGRYNGQIADGWGAAARDHEQLSVADELAQDGAISGAITSGEDRVYRGSASFSPAETGSGDTENPTGGLDQVKLDSQVAQGRLSGQVSGRPKLEPDILPWTEINQTIATGAAAEIFHEIGGPDRITDMSRDLTDLTRTVDTVRKQEGPVGSQGPVGPAGPVGPPGPRGDKGDAGQDAYILL